MNNYFFSDACEAVYINGSPVRERKFYITIGKILNSVQDWDGGRSQRKKK